MKFRGLLLLLLFISSQTSVCAYDIFNSLSVSESTLAFTKGKELKSIQANKFLADEVTEEESELEFSKKQYWGAYYRDSFFGIQRFNIEPSAPRGPDVRLIGRSVPIYLLNSIFRI